MNAAAPPSPSSSSSSPPLPRGAVACLALAAFGSGLSMRVNDALLPRLAGEFALTLGQASQVIGLFATAYGLAQLFFGPVGDRYGKYRVIAWATAACALTSVLCGMAPGFDALRLARVLAGATAAAVIPLSMAWIGDVVDYERRQPVLARFLIGQICGLSAGVWLGGFAADHLGWRAPYFLLAGFFALVSVALFALNRRLPDAARPVRAASDGSPLRRIATEFGGVLARPWARVVLGLVFLEGLFLFGPFAFIASHVHEAFQLSLSAAGALVMLFGLGGFAFAVSSGPLVRRLGEAGLARWGSLMMCGALVAVGFGPGWGWALAGCFVAGLGFYMVHNTLQVNATQMAPDRRGAAVAAFASCFFLGQSAGVALGGWLVGVIGPPGFLAIGAVGLLLIGRAFVAGLALRSRAAAAVAV
ncbi:MFS transporter [Methylibium petroleiphilum]|uniref:Putative membrane transport protein n=1 Tax=Methylibium petroleiphilum (strain ATCC BAA-1232 / LMG 22953 / PM1) TaxID=420662 RepID=A2SEG8_METPP|nr:MFS transporter [Methylibium petroleiphilum]ABM93957.1 putative membrane transport protein [Methylibium petroleiphilum PM1]